MDEDSDNDSEFSNIALCVCAAAESIISSEDELAHIQVSINTKVVLCKYIRNFGSSPLITISFDTKPIQLFTIFEYLFKCNIYK